MRSRFEEEHGNQVRTQKQEMIDYLDKIALQLIRWANESQSGGWSTHQVDPQKKLAMEILSNVDRWQR